MCYHYTEVSLTNDLYVIMGKIYVNVGKTITIMSEPNSHFIKNQVSFKYIVEKNRQKRSHDVETGQQ